MRSAVKALAQERRLLGGQVVQVNVSAVKALAQERRLLGGQVVQVNVAQEGAGR